MSKIIEKFLIESGSASKFSLICLAEDKSDDEYLNVLKDFYAYVTGEKAEDKTKTAMYNCIMDGHDGSVEGGIEYLRNEMIARGFETEYTLKRFDPNESTPYTYVCILEELARYYDRQTALGLPIDMMIPKISTYMQHIILL
jgi:hypothetical protein